MLFYVRQASAEQRDCNGISDHVFPRDVSVQGGSAECFHYAGAGDAATEHDPTSPVRGDISTPGDPREYDCSWGSTPPTPQPAPADVRHADVLGDPFVRDLPVEADSAPNFSCPEKFGHGEPGAERSVTAAQLPAPLDAGDSTGRDGEQLLPLPVTLAAPAISRDPSNPREFGGERDMDVGYFVPPEKKEQKDESDSTSSERETDFDFGSDDCSSNASADTAPISSQLFMSECDLWALMQDRRFLMRSQ